MQQVMTDAAVSIEDAAKVVREIARRRDHPHVGLPRFAAKLTKAGGRVTVHLRHMQYEFVDPSAR